MAPPPSPQTYAPRQTQTYQGKAVFTSTGDYTTDGVGVGMVQLSRITDMDWNVTYPVEQTMYLNAGNESYLPAPASVAVTLRWHNTNAQNERYIGLAQLRAPNGSLLLSLDSPKSLYITVEDQNGVDAIGATGAAQSKTVIGLAQGLLNGYTLSAAVGGLVESQASLTYLTSFISSGASGGLIPAVNYQDGSQVTGTFVLPPASSQYLTDEPSGYLSTGATNYTSAISSNDLIMTFPVGAPFGVTLTGYQSCYLQSFSCALSIERHELKPMGYAYSPTRPVVWPIHVDLSAEAIVSSYQVDQLQRLSCLGTGQHINVIVKQPCSNATLFGLYFTELQLVGQDFVASIGQHDVVSLHWRAILSSPSQAFFDPTVNYVVDSTGAPWGGHW